ncbi:hypothetical protein PHMEG_00026899 [Phytophthora megakarya]|uniref:Uncharacterized protein n=1 Tax=Phytophthora megakarya TaxID=4795 RepID=A0A225VA71_9STRA|nr:hypothetical protein PHMEG_00026899 [Phytophthora megakarya]
MDPVANTSPRSWREESLRQLHATTHTYTYMEPDHGHATSRLDRWYVTPQDRVRCDIAECKRDRANLHQKALFSAATHYDEKNTKHFFRRISAKFLDNVIATLDAVSGCPVRDVHDNADAWTLNFQQDLTYLGSRE